MAGSQDTEDLFRDLEQQFRRAEGAHRRRRFLTVAGVLVGIMLIFFGLSTHVIISVAGYGLLLACVLSLVEAVRYKLSVRIEEIAQQARDRQQRFGGTSRFRRGE